MKCRELKGHLPAYLSEKVPPDLRRQIKAHLRGCKKCKARIEEMKADAIAPEGRQETSPLPAVTVSKAPIEESPSSLKEREGASSGLKYPIPVAAMALLVIGGFYLYQRGGSDLTVDPSAVGKEAAPAVETAGGPPPVETEGKGPSQTAPPAAPPAPVTEPPTVKAHKASVDSLPRAGHRSARKTPEMKLLLISRDVTTVAGSVESQAAASSGKVLKKKQNELETKLVLLVPAERYEGFLESLQSLGLVKALSTKPAPVQGPLRVEVTIE